MQKTALIFLIGLAFLKAGNDAYAQQDSSQSKTPSVIFSLLPHYAFVNALKFDVELRSKKNPDRWWLISPELYTGDINRNGNANTNQDQRRIGRLDEPDWMRGFGAELFYKHFLSGKSKLARAYVAAGLSYRHLKIDYYGSAWRQVEQDGVIVWENYAVKLSGKVERLGPSFIMGMRDISGAILVDAYIGVGLREAWVDENLERYRDYSRHVADYAFNGVTPIAGLKLSAVIR